MVFEREGRIWFEVFFGEPLDFGIGQFLRVERQIERRGCGRLGLTGLLYESLASNCCSCGFL
jgi:hypothetical protein